MSAKNTAHKIIWLLLLLCPFFGAAQTFRLTQLTTHDGLPIDNIYAAAQDDDGFIWFGTDFGIARYDGYRFNIYDKKNGMANKAVTDIVYAGGDSLIFFSYPLTIQSVHKDGHINTLVEYTGFALQQLIKHNQQYYCYERGRNIFGILENGKYNLLGADSVFGAAGIKINNIVSLGEKGVAFCTNNGLFIKNGLQLLHIPVNRNIQFAVYTNRKTILVFSEGRLLELDEKYTLTELPIQFPAGLSVLYAAEEKNGDIWFRGLDKGIYRYNKNELQEISNRIGMENKAVNEFFPDVAGNFWICTDGSGILLKKNSAFINYETSDGLANNKILKLLKQKNELLIGTANGLSVLHKNRISTVPLPKTDKGLQYVTRLFQLTNNVTGICVLKTFSFPGRHDKAENRIKDFKIGQRHFRAFNATFAWQQDELNSWMVSYSSLMHVQNGSDKLETYDLSSLKVRKGLSMIAYENKLWLGTDAGIIFIDKGSISKKDSIGNYKIEQVFGLFIDKKNQLWIATDAGLFMYAKKIFTAIRTGSTAGSKYCTGLDEDADGKIWVSTWDGIFVFSGNNTTYYSTQDGLPSKTVNCILYDDETGALYAGTDNGLALLQKSGLGKNNTGRQVFINCNTAGYADSMVNSNSNLAYHDNNLNFYLSFPYYQGLSEVYYEYRIDKGPWTATTNPNILISDIGSGKHQFFVRAKINDEIISNTEARFLFTIEKPFYKTWWFWVIAAIILQLFIFLLINHFNKKAKEKKLAVKSQQAEYASLKQQAFTLLMNPHFIFNALNSVQYYVNRQDRQSANKYLSDFATLIRRSFDASQRSFVTLEEELETIRLYLQLEKMRFADKFEYNINVSNEAADEDWMLPSMMLQPFLENAVMHGLMPLEEKGLLTIQVTAENNCLYIIITDNGIGIAKSKALRSGAKHKSKGMQLINERLELLSKLGKEPITLTITEANPNATNPGTEIILTIPQDVYDVYQQQRKPA